MAPSEVGAKKLVLAFSAGPAYDLTAPAVVIHPPALCGFFDGDGGLVLTTNTQIVDAVNANGNGHLRCQAKGLANSQGRAVKYDTDNNPFFPGLLCGIVLPVTGPTLTANWNETVSASGNATLQCHTP